MYSSTDKTFILSKTSGGEEKSRKYKKVINLK
uniref:Uncharacterized protein n=1 Tax=Siphoviridae sp. ctHiz26 TaxID=2825423 RepID=A0A8S5Q7G9_9CAUD|nr:MAG TPA: hypothetical protein [Siphoviridae sp. ctHiz26]